MDAEKTLKVDPEGFYEALVSRGLDFFSGVPDSLLKDLCAVITERAPKERHVIAANEGNAVGMACGWHLATGRAGMVYMQNSGEGNAVNPLMSIADPDVYSIPMLLVIGWRGEPGVKDEPQHAKQGKVTLSLLEAMGIPFKVLDPENWEAQLDGVLEEMRTGSRPVALVVRKGSFSKYPFNPEDNGAPLLREEALGAILSEIGEGDLVVSTTGKESRELFELREARGEGHDADFLTVGGMGHTSSIAMGLALGTDRIVWCLDGDGSMIMHMGALAVAGQKAPSNLRYVVNANGAHESVGGQPNVGLSVDVSTILRACGFEYVREARTAVEIEGAVAAMRGEGRSALVVITRQGSRADLGRPTTTPIGNKESLMRNVGSQEAELYEGAHI